MQIPLVLASIATVCLTAGADALPPTRQAAGPGPQPPATVVPRPVRFEPVHPALPAVPEGVTHLPFGAIYRHPIGPRGLEFTDTVAALNGRRVRILGYMVRQSQPVPWAFLLSPIPITLHEREYGFAEDLPPHTIHVVMQRNSTPIVPFSPGLLLLTGTLELGAREEPDGRVSHIRLQLDPPTAEQRRALERAATHPRAETQGMTDHQPSAR